MGSDAIPRPFKSFDDGVTIAFVNQDIQILSHALGHVSTRGDSAHDCPVNAFQDGT